MSKSTRLTAEQINAIQELASKGVGNQELAERFNVSPITIGKYTSEIHKELRKKKIAKMIYYRDKRGFSNEDIAAKLGVSYNNVLELIGKQPAEITAASMKLAGQVRIARNKARKHAAEQIETKKAELARLEAERIEAERLARIEAERREAERLAKIERAKETVAALEEFKRRQRAFEEEALAKILELEKAINSFGSNQPCTLQEAEQARAFLAEQGVDMLAAAVA